MKKFLLKVAAWNFLIMLVMTWIYPTEYVANRYIAMFLLLPLVLWFLSPPRTTDDEKEQWQFRFLGRSLCLFGISFVWFILAVRLEVFGPVQPGFSGTGYPTAEHYQFLYTDIYHQYGGFRM